MLLASKCASLLHSRKPVQRNYLHFFKDFEPKCALEGLMKQITTEYALNQDNFGIKGNHESNNHKEPCFKFYRLTCPLTPRPQNVYIYVFQVYFIITLFQLPSVAFRSWD